MECIIKSISRTGKVWNLCPSLLMQLFLSSCSQEIEGREFFWFDYFLIQDAYFVKNIRDRKFNAFLQHALISSNFLRLSSRTTMNVSSNAAILHIGCTHCTLLICAYSVPHCDGLHSHLISPESNPWKCKNIHSFSYFFVQSLYGWFFLRVFDVFFLSYYRRSSKSVHWRDLRI